MEDEALYQTSSVASRRVKRGTNAQGAGAKRAEEDETETPLDEAEYQAFLRVQAVHAAADEVR
jgi:hypothetical protein